MASVIGHVFSNILLYQDMFNWYGRLISRLPGWIYKPLGLCSMCFSGQLAFWFCVIFLDWHWMDIWLIPYSVSVAIYLSDKY